MSISALRSLLVRVLQKARREGPRAAIEASARLLRERTFLDEAHLWFELSPAAERPRSALPEGLTLRRGDLADAGALEGLPGALSVPAARRRLAEGHELWTVRNGGGASVFACWVLHGSVPTLASPAGSVSLPRASVCFEDALTSPDYRGRGMVLPGAWTALLDDLARRGVERVFTKVEQENRAMRLAVRRVGFEELAEMRHRRAGPRRATAVRERPGREAGWLAAELLR